MDGNQKKDEDKVNFMVEADQVKEDSYFLLQGMEDGSF